jgi:hypothetical protein
MYRISFFQQFLLQIVFNYEKVLIDFLSTYVQK